MDLSNSKRPEQMLNEYQTRRVKIILSLFEEDLQFALRWLDGNPEEGSLYRRRLVLSEDLRIEARRVVKDGLDEIRQLAEALDFKPEDENAAKSVMGRLNTDWENLSDLHASNLKGLGAVNPNLSHFLDKRVDRLSQIALKLGDIFLQGPADLNADKNSFDKQEKVP
ncbi:MAG: hypothetical protein P4L50_16960 [Anaerolineaceae bacterium]|nr:hypothetical protein [Anaerolineaceae bacterium]